MKIGLWLRMAKMALPEVRNFPHFADCLSAARQMIAKYVEVEGKSRLRRFKYCTNLLSNKIDFKDKPVSFTNRLIQ